LIIFYLSQGRASGSSAENGAICFFRQVALVKRRKEITMKCLIAFAMMSPGLLFGQLAEPSDTDIRVINGRSVDLAPLHQWYRNPDGRDRPLKHWMKLTLLEVKPALGGSYLSCAVDGEIGRREVLFKALPAETTATVSRIQSLQASVNTLQQEIEAQEPIVRRDEAQYEGSVVRSSRVEIGPNFGTRRYEYERPARRAVDARLDRLALTEKQELATKLYDELTALRQNTNAYSIIAMDTKRKYGGLPIWETGLEPR
jgi:hypothetical protein